MPFVRRLSLVIFFSILSICALHAQYIVNPASEETFADQEYLATSSYLAESPAMPHLSPDKVAEAMKNPDYIPVGHTPFTFVIAHRGSHTAPGCPENTACAIAAAYHAGSDAIELDVKLTADKAPVLGHDVAIARELNNWQDESGITIQRSAAWNPFGKFPVLDSTYLDLTKYPFLNNFAMLDSSGNTIVNPNNPTRSTMRLSQIQGSYAVDTYDLGSNYRQLTLYEALYLVNKYYPMNIWLDIKSKNDLDEVKSVLSVARNRMGTAGALKYISLKLDWKTSRAVGWNPGSYLNLDNILYFMVIGTGNLDDIATYAGRPTPTTADDENSQVYDALQATCNKSIGCLGLELSHKYPNAPTRDLATRCWPLGCPWQIAGFHTVPQYSWYWNTLPGQKKRASSYGRTFPRTDGSCCFALTDSLNISTMQLGAETHDLRPLYSWNEATFSTITTDEPLLVLRDLYLQGKRPVTTATLIGGTATTIPSGGDPDLLGEIRDGLYYIQERSTNKRIIADDVIPTLTPSDTVTPSMMWYVSRVGSSARQYTITNIATAYSLLFLSEGSDIDAYPGVLDSLYARWQIDRGPGDSGYQFRVPGTPYHMSPSTSLSRIVASGSSVGTWNLIPINTPSSEVAMQQAGPAGYTYCADEGSTCSFAEKASVAFGANGQFRYLPYYTGASLSCSTSSFNDIDPLQGVKKACFYAPYDHAATLSSGYSHVGVGEGSQIPVGSTPSPIAFGYYDLADHSMRFTYKMISGTYNCGVAVFGIDPAVLSPKKCYPVDIPSLIPIGPDGFTFCSMENETCGFSGAAVVAYGATYTQASPPSYRFTYKTFANGVTCENGSYGMDPARGTPKACFYLPLTALGYSTHLALPSTTSTVLPYAFQGCAAESGTCSNIPIGSLLAFGGVYNSAPSYSFITTDHVNNTSTSTVNIPCNVSTFNNVDPTPGIAKNCFWVSRPMQDRGPQGFSYCSSENAARGCAFSGVAQIAFGVDGKYVYQTKTNSTAKTSLACTVKEFDEVDPYPGVPKGCFYRLY